MKYQKIIFGMFLFSGFCGLLYQVVWIRLAYALFGVITPVLSVVISVFMLGLSIGAWAGGKWIAGLRRKSGISPIIFYALTEFFIGIGAFAVPVLFTAGEKYLLSMGEMNSLRYLFFSALVMGLSILPWCILMGFTFPFMMAFIKENNQETRTSFSFLYLANVIGAMGGTLITALVLIELFGFKTTISMAAFINIAISITGFWLGTKQGYPFVLKENPKQMEHTPGKTETISPVSVVFILSFLFATGFVSMSMEVVWIRAFTPVLKTRTYSFATLLTVYLMATWIGSYLYRKHLRQKKVILIEILLASLLIVSFLPVVMTDPRLGIGIPSVLISIFPLCAILGYLTPMLIDQYSSGHPRGAGKAYALNSLGCIIGPIFASYVLLPFLGVKMSMIILTIPFLFCFWIVCKKTKVTGQWPVIVMSIALVMLFRSVFVNESYEEVYASYSGSIVRRDHTATVVSIGTGMRKQLVVNGIGITYLTPLTKIMAHMPLSLCSKPPESALVICFGMGTTYRSSLSWGIETTAVELVPSVKDAFGYYFEDAGELQNHPKGKIVIDDGRRFLKRTTGKFDVITIDPPPPVEAAGSGLLYSEEFYRLIQLRLRKGGILQQWFPGGEDKILQAVTRSLVNTFPHVRVFPSHLGWGVHFIASMEPVILPPVREMIKRMPPDAIQDFIEWYDQKDLHILWTDIMTREIPLESLLNDDKRVIITDNRPFNEYYVLRRLFHR